ncbi:Rap1a/Tai family immunity protein [Solimonas soli]|uniref:Rap1a/Tai family immunity protein n=1 Tax=Solimonas soli TaxID=413479 RepID=UPI0004812F3D|nr:Rap1a/Tai family immunity protein [Solimonas soli]
MKRLLWIGALLAPAAASAMSAGEYLGHCQQRTTYDQAVCMGYLDALLEGRLRPTEVASLNTVALGDADGYCLNGATLPQIRSTVVLRLLRMSAAQKQIEASVLILDGLRRDYPLANCAN